MFQKVFLRSLLYSVKLVLFVGIGGGAGGAQAPNDGVVGSTMHSGPPRTLTPVDRNEAYCFHELVLNLPAPMTKMLSASGGFAP